MAINYPGYAVPRGYDKPDILRRFAEGFGFGEGIANEAAAKKALAAFADQVSGGNSSSLSLSALSPLAGGRSPGTVAPGMVEDSHIAAVSATDPMLKAYMDSTERRESGGNPNAANPRSSAEGLFQFTDPTWKGLVEQYGPDYGLTLEGKMNPDQQRTAMGLFTRDNARTLKSAGIPINPGSLYSAHFLGAQGAANVLGQPDETPLMALVGPEVINANPFLQDMTVGDFRQWAGDNGRNEGGGYSAPRVGQTAQPQTVRPDPATLRDLVTNPITREFGLGLMSGQTKAPTADISEYQFAVSQGYTGTFADWQAANKAGVTVNTGDNSSAFGKKADEIAAERLNDIVAAGAGAQTFMGDLEALTEIGKGLNTGKTAEVMNMLGPFAEAFGIEIEGLGEGQAYDAIVSRMAPQMRAPGSGASSDFDAKQFLKSLPGLGKTPEGNALIIETFTAVQEAKVAAAEIASLALGNEITWQEADKRIRALGDPFTAFKKAKKDGMVPARNSTPPVTAPAANLPTISTQDEFDALPSGAEFIDAEDGKPYRKP